MIYDISPPVSSSTAVFPGDTPPTREVLLDMQRGDALTLSTLRTTVHVGAHADAPSHYGADGRTIEQQLLDLYLGHCQVIGTTGGRSCAIAPGDLQSPIASTRVLLRTESWPDTENFNEDFAGLTVELIEALTHAGVRTIGVDTPSVDAATSKDLPVHRAVLQNDMAILECLRLDDVPPGFYELIALPLNLVGFDASPVRAVLRTLDDD